MAKKTTHSPEAASQVFRQFAWNLAGALAQPKEKPVRSSGRAGTRRAANTNRASAK